MNQEEHLPDGSIELSTGRLRRLSQAIQEIMIAVGAGFEESNNAREFGEGVDRAVVFRVSDYPPVDESK